MPMCYLANIPPVIIGEETLYIRKGENFSSNITILSNNLANVTIQFLRVYIIVNGSSNSSTNGTEVSYFSSDVPTITKTTRQGNVTEVNFQWNPSTDNITGFSILATDDKFGSALYTPNIIYCRCKHSMAKCRFASPENNTEEESGSIGENVTFEVNITIRGILIPTTNNTEQVKKGISEGKLLHSWKYPANIMEKSWP